jgi:hypothetical protein
MSSLEKLLGEAHVVGILRGCSLPGHGGLAHENELGDVGEGQGIATGDAFPDELPDEIAEEEIDFIGGGEGADILEKLGGENLGVYRGCICLETAGVVGAERRASGAAGGTMMGVNHHAAAVAAGVLVLALLIGVLFWGHGLAFRKIELRT